MKRAALITLAVLGLLVVIGFWQVKSTNNHMVEKQEQVEAQWSEVQNQYQRRYELIPNLVNTVKGASNFEKETLTEVTNARAKVGQVNINANDLSNEQAMKRYSQAQGQLGSALNRLMVVSERYPELQATQAFRDLMTQLEGTQNRITVARKRFNEAVRTYNTYIKKFPNNLYANLFGYDKRAYFEASKGAEQAPKVQF